MLKFLLIEDNELDAELTRHVLTLEGLEHRMVRVANKELFLESLASGCPDLILSDHGLQTFNGFTALRISRKFCPSIPFIFLTGGLRDEEKKRIRQEGGVVVVLKQEMFHTLGPAVKSALARRNKTSPKKRSQRKKKSA